MRFVCVSFLFSDANIILIFNYKSFHKFFCIFFAMSTQSDAIRDYFHENGISNRDVAERLGVHEGSVSNILSGRYGISKKIAARSGAGRNRSHAGA